MSWKGTTKRLSLSERGLGISIIGTIRNGKCLLRKHDGHWPEPNDRKERKVRKIKKKEFTCYSRLSSPTSSHHSLLLETNQLELLCQIPKPPKATVPCVPSQWSIPLLHQYTTSRFRLSLTFQRRRLVTVSSDHKSPRSLSYPGVTFRRSRDGNKDKGNDAVIAIEQSNIRSTVPYIVTTYNSVT